jgi:cell division protein FtsQ
MRKFFRILLIIPLLYIVVIPIYLASSSNAGPCSGIEIVIRDSSDYHFITEKHLLNLVHNSTGRIIGTPAKDIPVAEIENRINVLRELKVAEVYMTIDRTLKIYVDQRDPLMRVMPEEGGDFFVDDEGVVVRKRNLYNPRLHLVGGNINITQAMLNGVSVLDTSIRYTVLRDIYHFVNYISDDSFWSAQIDQILVDRDDEIDLIPRVGNHVIHLGTTENFEGKLRNLEAFYQKVLPEVGWNRYSMISLEFKDQIVCKKR